VASYNTQAASIWLKPISWPPNVDRGDVGILELWADASDVCGFLAGALDLFYDNTVLAYNDDFAFDPAFPTDPDLSSPGTNAVPTVCTGVMTPVHTCSGVGEINNIAFGNFAGLAADGPTLVGTMSFGGFTGVYDIVILTMADSDFSSPWFATDGTDLSGLVVYHFVPLPAAVTLMICGLG
jgi:hypothetical protein